MKLLVIQLGGPSALLLTTPLLRCFARQKEGSSIHVLLRPGVQPVLQHNPYVTQLHFLQDDANCNDLQEENYDHIVDLTANAVSKKITKALKLPSTVYRSLGFQKTLLTNLKWNFLPDRHLADRYLATVKDFGVSNDGAGLDLLIPPTEVVTEKDIPASHHLGFIAIVIGGSKFTRRMPPGKIRELCEAIPHPVMLIGGADVAATGASIAAFDTVKVYNACGKFSFHESADLIRRSKLVIAHDTGFMQIAAAFRKRLITVWGSTVPSFGGGPYYGNFSFENGKQPFDGFGVGLWCRPCTVNGKDRCPLGHFKCMKKINADQLAALAMKRIQQA